MQGVSRHNEVLKYIADFRLYYDRMPCAKEIQHDLKISRTVLSRILMKLVQRGRLVPTPRHCLAYRVASVKGNGVTPNEAKVK